MSIYLESLILRLDLAKMFDDVYEIDELIAEIREYKINYLFDDKNDDEIEFFNKEDERN